MAKMINERASTSADIPPTPDSSTLSTHVQQLADNMYSKVAAYLQGQIEGISYGKLLLAEVIYSKRILLSQKILNT